MLEILEHGDIQFWFRPSVQPAEAARVTLGVQSLFAVLSPAGGGVHRRLRIGKNRMPARSRDRFWARVERVGSLQRVLGDLLEAERYVTKTRGARYQPAARPLAAGDYAFLRRDDHLHLSYDVRPDGAPDEPASDDESACDEEPDPDADDLPRIESASHLVLFKNLGDGSRIWSTAGAPGVLDTERAEIVLVGARPPLDPAAPAIDAP